MQEKWLPGNTMDRIRQNLHRRCARIFLKNRMSGKGTGMRKGFHHDRDFAGRESITKEY